MTVSPELLSVLVEALVACLEEAALAFEALQLDVGVYREKRARFDMFCDALDAVCWGASAEIDADAHRDALQAALAERLRAERHAIADGRESIEEGHRGGEAQVRGARRQTLVIEAFMHDAGLTTPPGGGADAQG